MPAEALTIRPRSGTRRLRRHASLRLENGAITATDRRGRTRRFELTDAADAPECFGRGLLDGRALYWLEDRMGRSVMWLDLGDWDGDEFLQFTLATGLDSFDKKQKPPGRPDALHLMDHAYFSWAVRASAVGAAAISLLWLGIVPELFVYVVGLPALVFLLWCLLMNKLSSPSAEQQRKDDEKLIALGETWLKHPDQRPGRKKKARKHR